MQAQLKRHLLHSLVLRLIHSLVDAPKKNVPPTVVKQLQTLLNEHGLVYTQTVLSVECDGATDVSSNALQSSTLAEREVVREYLQQQNEKFDAAMEALQVQFADYVRSKDLEVWKTMRKKWASILFSIAINSKLLSPSSNRRRYAL